MEINKKDMTQEEKELVIKDLSGRLPYGVMCKRGERVRKVVYVKPYQLYAIGLDNGEYISQEYTVEDVKPYLRPISTMTEEEKEELRDTYAWVYSEYPWDDEDEDPEDVGCHPEPSAETYDWYNRKMFDYRGLIPKGLANVAPDGMYNN